MDFSPLLISCWKTKDIEEAVSGMVLTDKVSFQHQEQNSPNSYLMMIPLLNLLTRKPFFPH